MLYLTFYESKWCFWLPYFNIHWCSAICWSVLQSKMEATFGPTFSAVASGSKGNNQEFFTSTLLHYVTIAELLLGIVMF